jgi:hypothetical protein
VPAVSLGSLEQHLVSLGGEQVFGWLTEIAY